MEGVPKPSVLVKELGLVIGIGRKRLVRRDDRRLDLLHVLCLEELLEQELLEVRDLLEALDAILEDLLDLLNNLRRVVVILRDQLVRLADQVKLEQRVGVLVASEVLVDLALDLKSPGELILTHRQISVGLITIVV
jgi:hypothetical protein